MGFPAKISTKDLGRLLGLSPQRINQLAGENVVIKTDRDQFDAAKSIKSYVLFRENAASSEAGRHHGLSKERAQMVRTQRELAQIELDEKLGRVVEIDAATEIIGRCLIVVKNRLLGLGAKLGPQANPSAPILAQRVIYDGICEALEELSSLEAYGDTERPQSVATTQ